MKTTKEVAFYAYDKNRHLLAVRAGVPVRTALQHSLEMLETAHDLLLTDQGTMHAATVMVETAQAIITAAIGDLPPSSSEA